jgi:hypothetical protein
MLLIHDEARSHRKGRPSRTGAMTSAIRLTLGKARGCLPILGRRERRPTECIERRRREAMRQHRHD